MSKQKPAAKIVKKPQLVRWAKVEEEQLNAGVSRKMIIGQNEMFSRLALKKGAVVPAHNHVSEQISFVLRGAITFTIEGKEITVRDNEVLVIPPHVVHSVVTLEDTDVLDCFSPIRHDWLSGDDSYLRTGKSTMTKGQ